MDKNAIKKYAVWARKELIARVTQKAEQYEITEKKTTPADADSIGGRVLTAAEKKQRQALIAKIKQNGFEQVMEEVAYTWFNRFTALRFMEVNNYLPSHTKVFTNENGEFKPQILADAIQLDLEGLNMDKVFELKDANKTEELYKYLLITQCNALSGILPRMFQRLSDYTELLLPDYLLRKGSVIEQMIALIPEEDWTDQVQIIGWLYQFYIAEPKEKLINAHKQYKSKDVPFVTQLFTPDWIAHFMVDNSLGRLWLDGHPNDNLQSEWKYYLKERKQDEKLIHQIEDIRKKAAEIRPEEIKIIDPCMGSGHILCVLFDSLVRIYEEYGYSAREAASSILEKNLWGLDIDERAVQLSYFAVMMKARQYDRRFFGRKIEPHVYVIDESNSISKEALKLLSEKLPVDRREDVVKQAIGLVEETHNAKAYGSLITVSTYDWELLEKLVADEVKIGQIGMDIYRELSVKNTLKRLINVGRTMSQKYHVVVTNPPYMNSSYMPTNLKVYIKNNYPQFKNDMFSAFTNKAVSMAAENGHIGLLMPYVWMFISSYEKMRNFINKNVTITSLVQLEYNAFEAACVPVAALTMCKNSLHFSGEYVKLSEFRGADNQGPKTLEAVNNPDCGYRYTAKQDIFSKIPGSPIAYWVGDRFIQNLEIGKPIKKIARARSGAKTGKNELFLKLWWEVPLPELFLDCRSYNSCVDSEKTWFPYNKGGDAQNWYGNRELVVDFYGGGKHIKEYSEKNGTSIDLNAKDVFFKRGITWTALTSSRNTFRFSPYGAAFDSNKGPMVFPEDEDQLYYLLALFISPVAQYYFKVFNPTISLQNGDVDNLPVIMDENSEEIIQLSKENVSLTKQDWDSFETSWDYRESPLIGEVTIESAFERWRRVCDDRFNRVMKNEERINELLIKTYGFENVLSSKVTEGDITLHRADLKRDIEGLISYAVGCMFGRYSLDEKGIVYAGGNWDETRYKKYLPNKDAILPICDDEYFDNDIVERFTDFISAAYGEETLDQNLIFIAKALGGKGTPQQIIRNYFINDFYIAHCSLYAVNGSGKRPIYWLFDSGKKNGFKCLIYLHRYHSDTIAKIRTDYVHEQQSRYRTAISGLKKRLDHAEASERIRLNKQLSSLEAQETEIRKFEEKIHHLADQMIEIDLAEGVKKNYSRFQDVLAKIK